MAEGEKKTNWDQALDVIKKIRVLEAKGDRTNRDLMSLQTKLRHLLGQKPPRVERRGKTRIDRRKKVSEDRRGRARKGNLKERRSK